MMYPSTNERFQLRPWSMKDAPSLAQYANNINVWNNVRDVFPHPYTEEDAKAYITMVQHEEPALNFAIIVDGKAVGGVGFIPQKDVERFNAEIGYWIGEPFWGKGIITEVVRTITQHIFSTTDIFRIFACAYEYNTASMRVMEKAGFRKVGIMEKAAFKNGRFVNFHYYELLK